MNTAHSSLSQSRQRRTPSPLLPTKRKRRSEFRRDETTLEFNDLREEVRSSEGLNWSSMLAAQVLTQPLEQIILPASYLFFAVPMQSMDLTLEMDHNAYNGVMPANNLTMIAPGTKYALNLREPGQLFYAYIKHDVLVDVADEIYCKRLSEIDLQSPLENSDLVLRDLLETSRKMLHESQDSSLGSDYIARAIVAQFLSRHTQLRETPRSSDSQIPLSKMQIQRVNDYMQANLHSTFQVADLAASIGLSRTIFFERFVRTVKKTPNQYLQILRVTRAKQLLHDPKLSLVDIGFACGYSDQSHFSRLFKRFVGASPRKYRLDIS